MKLNRKWVLIAALVLSIAMATSGTLAYLTDKDTKTNTFTLGNVDITLNEDNWEDNSTLIPGKAVAKDPTIKNNGKNDAYVWMKVKIPSNIYSYIQLSEFGSNWSQIGSATVEGDDTIITLKYSEKLTAKTGVTSSAFSTVTLKAETPTETISALPDNVTITVEAYAIEASHFSNFEDAYTAYGNEKDNVAYTTVEAQEMLDNATSGTVIRLAAGNYGMLEVRPTANNGTAMYCETHDYTTTDAAEFIAHRSDGQYHTTPRYTYSLKNVKIIGADGAKVAGLLITSGHIYGDVTDYVLNTTKDYYSTLNIDGLTFENIEFTGKVDINTSDATSIYDGVTFEKCDFTTGGTDSTNGVAIRYYNEANNGNVKNIKVNECNFNNCYQGVYVHHVNGISVTDCTFDTTGHNAIALQGHDGAVNLKNVVITGNTFKNIADRVIRFNEVGADSNITIQGNVATNSGDSDGEVMKATSIAEGVTTSISGNNWGDGKVVVNDKLKDQ